MDLFRYIARRVIISLVTIFVVITATFFLMRAMPGKPFTGAKAVPKAIMDNLEKKYGLDKPLLTQYGLFLKNLSKGDLGISMTYKGRKVTDIIKLAFPVSADLGIRSLIFGVLAGLLLGIIASLNHNKALDSVTMVVAVLGVSIPGFLMATLIQYFIGYHVSNGIKAVFDTSYQVFPISQWHASLKWEQVRLGDWAVPGLKVLSWRSIAYLFSWECIRYTVLPATALGFASMATVARYMRTSMLDVLHQDYIKTAKAKGLSTVQVTVKHAIRNAILPVVTILGPLTVAILSGTFIIELIFSIPGLGKFFIQSIQMYDYTMILGLTIFYATLMIFMIMLVDIAYGIIDPRIRLAKGRA